MKGDLSRGTFRRRKHYRKVEMQQGRVQIDQDWNEQEDIWHYLLTTIARDLIGPHGGPRDGFKIGGNLGGKALRYDFSIHEGHYFLDGLLCDNEKTCTYTSQPTRAVRQSGLQGAGVYIAYLDVWERNLSYLDDPELKEVALLGPDTAKRTKTDWQVKVLPLQWAREDGPKINAEKVLRKAVARADMPTLVPGAGYTGPENRLYRVEIHNSSSDLNGPTFQWSRDNGRAVSPILAVPFDPNDGYVELEDGVEVKFSAGTYQTGEYWLIPARSATKSVVWLTRRRKPVPMAPHGMRHHYCPLAIVTYQSNGIIAEIEDQRRAIEIFGERSDVEGALTYYQELIAANRCLGSLSSARRNPQAKRAERQLSRWKARSLARPRGK